MHLHKYLYIFNRVFPNIIAFVLLFYQILFYFFIFCALKSTCDVIRCNIRVHLCMSSERFVQTGASWCEIDRSIDALCGRPLPGNRARSARGGRASVLLVGAGGAWRAGPPCRPDEARRARAVAHRAAADGGTKVEGARLAGVRVELGLP